MALSAAQINRLLRQVGRPDDADLTGRVEEIAEEYEDKAALHPRLLLLYVKREILKELLGGEWKSIDWKQGDESEDEGDRFDHLNKLLTDTKDEIGEIEEEAETALMMQGTGIAQLSTTTTVPAPSCRPDPSDRAYRGDPLRNTNLWR